MAYCTLQQLKDRYSERMLIDISSRGDTAAVEVDEALIARAQADADALIDGYLKARYGLPLAIVPPLLTDLSLMISIYKAHAHVAEDKIVRDYEGALKTLVQISNGIVRLDVAGVEPASSGASEVRTNEPHRPLTADTMRGYI